MVKVPHEDNWWKTEKLLHLKLAHDEIQSVQRGAKEKTKSKHVVAKKD